MKLQALAIAFVDLARFQIESRRVTDTVLVEILEEYYGRVADGVKPAGGRVVKYMGDGVLVVFPIERASQAVRTLLILKSELDARFAQKKFATPFVVRMGTGDAMVGMLGPKGDKRYDVIGQAVNRTAAIKYAEGVTLTAEAWGTLDPRTQKLFTQKGDYYVPN